MVIGKKQLFIIAVIGIFATLFSIGVVVTNKVKSASYVRTKATIVNISSKRGASPRTDSSASYWVTYSFDANGTTYSATKQVFSKNGKDIGDTAYIRYDPSNPEKLENTLAEGVGVALTLFFAAFTALLILSTRRR